MKRKASVLDEPSIYHQSSSPTSTSSSNLSFSVAAAPPFPSFHLPTSSSMNSRTRKRYRDNRPDETTIHETTLARLFNAQRRPLEPPSQLSHLSNYSPTPTDSNPHLWTREQTPPPHPPLSPPHTTLPPAPDTSGQRSIDSFFPQSRDIFPRTQTQRKPNSALVGFINPRVHNPSPLQTSLPDPTVTASRCEDCGRDLWRDASYSSCSAAVAVAVAVAVAGVGDGDGMDLDYRPDSPGAFAAFACACCARRVCDLCSVRGDERVCLECTLRGAGGGGAGSSSGWR